MTTLQLTGRITDKGELEVKLPDGVQAGEVEVTIKLPVEERPWTEEEIAEMLKPGTPKTGAEIAAKLEAGEYGDGWESVGDGATWVEEQRRKEQVRNKW